MPAICSAGSVGECAEAEIIVSCNIRATYVDEIFNGA
jgi:hypothetical protein